MMSLNSRLLLAASVVLASFLGVTGITLDRVFRDSAEDAVRGRLEGHVHALIAATIVPENDTLKVSDELMFFSPLFGLFAQAASNNGIHIWRSSTMIQNNISFQWVLAPAEEKFSAVVSESGIELFAYSLGVTWDESENIKDGYTFSVAEYQEVYKSQVSAFRKNLWGWLGGVALLLLTVQGSILRWSLSPLRHVAEDLSAIENGAQLNLQGTYPKELRGLTNNLNALIKSEREHMERYRNSLDNLAHSLKTPLAVLQAEVERQYAKSQLEQTLQEQVDHMSKIVEYQLQRAAASGRFALGSPIDVRRVGEKVVAAMNKVYASRTIVCELQIDPNVVFFGDEGDLMELLGNLVDNAYKWCRSSTIVSIYTDNSYSTKHPGLLITVEDDGPGVSAIEVDTLLQRGKRGATNTPGHGIGLAIVQDIVKLYGGSLKIKKSHLGGAKIEIGLPGDIS